ncbi:MAG: type II toxin-antitoxin system RatA family toxin [Betaproteobacteria bacterium]|nr:type II toxin-antitoxin system RatA family toxin [Betaproteobacteria bacterium]
MPQVTKSVLVPYSAAAMFDLVDAVERYPDFLPWCGSSHVLERSPLITVAAIEIQYLGVRQSFTTANEKQGQEWMHLSLREGPFRQLNGHWHFRQLAPEACKVELYLEYAFSNRVLEGAIGPVFGMIAETLIERFVERADALYGRAERENGGG